MGHKSMIPFFVADRPASLRILKGSELHNYNIKVGLMTHANTSRNFQTLFRTYPCTKDDFCDVINDNCPYNGNISKCPKGKKIKAKTIKICDSGIFTKSGCIIDNYEKLFEIYEYMDSDYGVMIDVFKNKGETIKSAKRALMTYNDLYGKNPPFKLVGVAQGNSLNDYVECYEYLKELGYDYIAIGGLLKKNNNTVRYVRVKNEEFMYKVLKTVRDKYPNDWLFVLGCYHPKRHEKFEKLKIFGSDYKGWIFHYKKDEFMNKKEAQRDRFKQVRKYVRTEVYDKLCAKRLLVLSCSDRKKKIKELTPAIEIYDGVNYRSIKKAKREGNLSNNLDILIISAKYGLLNCDDPINYYKQRITPDRAKELRIDVLPKLKMILKNNNYGEIFVNLGKDYLPVIDGFEKFVPSDTRIIYAKGGIGQKMSQMKKWLIEKHEFR
jgi:hypothetical protein